MNERNHEKKMKAPIPRKKMHEQARSAKSRELHGVGVEAKHKDVAHSDDCFTVVCMCNIISGEQVKASCLRAKGMPYLAPRLHACFSFAHLVYDYKTPPFRI